MMSPEERAQFRAEFKARCEDEIYSQRLGQMIDEFFAMAVGMAVADVVENQLYQDMIEVLSQISIMENNPYYLAVRMFLLGAYLAIKGEVQFPRQVN